VRPVATALTCPFTPSTEDELGHALRTALADVAEYLASDGSKSMPSPARHGVVTPPEMRPRSPIA